MDEIVSIEQIGEQGVIKLFLRSFRYATGAADLGLPKLHVCMVIILAVMLHAVGVYGASSIRSYNKSINFNERIAKGHIQGSNIRYDIAERKIGIYLDLPDKSNKSYEFDFAENINNYDINGVGNIAVGVAGITANSLFVVDAENGNIYRFDFPPIMDKKNKDVFTPRYKKGSIKVGDIDNDGNNEIVVTEVRESYGRGELIRMNIIVYKLNDKKELQKMAEKRLDYSSVGSLELLKLKDKQTIILAEEGQEEEGGFVFGYAYNPSNKVLRETFSQNLSAGNKRAALVVPLDRAQQDIVFADDGGDVKRFKLENHKFIQVGDTLKVPGTIIKVNKIIDMNKYSIDEKGFVIRTKSADYVYEP